MSVIAPPQSQAQLEVGADRRTAELGLMVLAWVIGMFAFAQVQWATDRPITVTFWLLAGITAGAGIALHLAVRAWARYAEPIMLPVSYLLNLLGLAMIYRLDVAAANRAESNGSPNG